MAGRAREPDSHLGDAVAEIRAVRHRGGAANAVEDRVAREEPLEIQLAGASLAVVMRTPGHDAELALGFLVTERVVRQSDDVVAIRHADEARSQEAVGNVIQVRLAEHVTVDLAALRRNLFANSSCGVCGKATLENALTTAAALRSDVAFDVEFLYGLVSRLRSEQAAFAETGGMHAAALFGPRGELVACREDVGRHNAVDKVIGYALTHEPAAFEEGVLLVSGRISFEIVQKALAAGVPLVAGISAPTSLAIDLAEASGIAVVGFLRDRSCNVYGRTSRVRGVSDTSDLGTDTVRIGT